MVVEFLLEQLYKGMERHNSANEGNAGAVLKLIRKG